jgi:hypothetical protein
MTRVSVYSEVEAEMIQSEKQVTGKIEPEKLRNS